MIRRLFVLAIAFGLAILATIGSAQQPEKVPVVGILVPSIGPDHPLIVTLRKRLRELGYVDGQNIRFEFRGAQGQVNRLPRLAEELVRLKVDVIFTAVEPAIWAVKKATSTIPIAMIAYSDDPTASGLIDSLSRPGGNITGIFTRQPELSAKRLELLKEALPGLSRVAVFWDAFSSRREREEVERAARALGIQVEFQELRAPEDLMAAFRTAKKRGAGAVITLYAPTFYVNRARVAEAALENRLPVTGYAHELTRTGGLITYGTDVSDNYYRIAYFIDRILKGSKPGDLPVEESAKFQLVVNLKTAKVLGITIPQSILLRADEVIR